MSKAWRRRVLGRGRWIVWPIVGLSVLLSGLPSPYAYLGGLVAGTVLMAWIALNEMVPRHISKWWDGAEGERQTERVLRPLEKAGWIVAHDLEAPYGNVDHLVLSNAGVFLLDSKRWRGVVHVDGDVPTSSQIEDPDATWSWPGLAPRMRGLSAGTHDALRKLTGVSAWVNAVVVVWAPFEQSVVSGRSITYVHGDQLVEWLTAQPRRLSDQQVGALSRVIAR
jgi:hypothetical protein